MAGKDAGTGSAADFVPEDHSLEAMRAAAQACRGCDLYQDATQAVFGEGPAAARLMLVGEVPGDQEDQQGRPFVGPAGRLLDKALAEAGIAREQAYLTNVVKHFKWSAQGARRMHKKPSAREISACKPWLHAEIEAVRPALIVCLGATAAQALLGRGFRVTQSRGDLLRAESPDAPVMATLHPSAVLRMPEAEDRHRAYADLVEDLRRAAAYAQRP